VRCFSRHLRDLRVIFPEPTLVFGLVYDFFGESNKPPDPLPRDIFPLDGVVESGLRSKMLPPEPTLESPPLEPRRKIEPFFSTVSGGATFLSLEVGAWYVPCFGW
jgi:hypothetical protein